MKVPPWCKPAFWGVVVGAIGIMIIGFAWWGWVLGSTAERMAKDRADGAVTEVLVPICVARFMGASRCGGEAHRIPERRVMAAKSSDCQRRLGDGNGQHRPEYGGGTGLRSTAREHQDLASSHMGSLAPTEQKFTLSSKPI